MPFIASCLAPLFRCNQTDLSAIISSAVGLSRIDMWKAFIECCCGATERAPPTVRTPIRPKSSQPSSRTVSTSARRAALADEPEPELAPRVSANDVKRQPILVAEESSSSEGSSPVSAGSSSSAAAAAAVASSSSSVESEATCKGKNYLFYQNKIPSKPSPGGLISEIHQQWFGNYSLLEFHHGYIQVRLLPPSSRITFHPSYMCV